MRETASAALRPASLAEVEAWCKAFGEPPNEPRRRGQTAGEAWETHEAYIDKLRDAFAQSFGRTPTGQQSHDIPLLSFAEGRTPQVLTQTAKRVERHWELASWETTAIYLPTQAARREYDVCHDAVQQADTAWEAACQGLQVAGQPLEELLRAARDGASQPSSADDALHAVILMDLELLGLGNDLNPTFDEADHRRNRHNYQTKMRAVPSVANKPVVATYNQALEVVTTTMHERNAAYTALWQQGERIVVLLHAKGEYRDPDDLTVRLRGREAQVRGVPIVRVTFERARAREQLLQTAGQAYHDQVQTDALS